MPRWEDGEEGAQLFIRPAPGQLYREVYGHIFPAAKS